MCAQIAAVVKLLYKWGYIYVENLTWVQMAPNNTIITAPSPYAQCSHLTLFIFRKNGMHLFLGWTCTIPHWTQIALMSKTPEDFWTILCDLNQIRLVTSCCVYAWRFEALSSDGVACKHFLLRDAGAGKDIELRHQRNPDVLFDCVRKQEGE